MSDEGVKMAALGVTRISRLTDGPESLEKLADDIEHGVRPLTDLALSLLCAALCRRLAALERKFVTGEPHG